MRIAIFENIMTPGGHEVDFNRILVEELAARGHEIFFYVPENFKFQFDYKVPVKKIKGDAVVYTKSRGIKKIVAAAKREINRQRWYHQLCDAQEDFDALIFPTSTYRYLRALNHSVLKKISRPTIFILHGINPDEAPHFLKEAPKFLSNENIKPVVMSLAKNIFGELPANVRIIFPPTYIGRDLSPDESKKNSGGEVLRLGFFGQYRREKKLRDLLDIFVNTKFRRKVLLTVQGSTMHDEDAEDFEKIIKKYSAFDNLKFVHRGLVGADWQRAINEVDALLMPYSAPRYKYNCSAMLFTAVGFGKPVVASNDINPEVFQMYNVGETFESGDRDAFANVIEKFVNDFDKNFPTYSENLKAAGEEFSPKKFAERLEKIIAG